MKQKTPNIFKYILISALIFVMAVLVSQITRAVLLLTFTVEQAGLVTSMIEGIVGAIAAGFVLYQLKVSSCVEESQNSIEEAQFILRYNQAFIQDKSICNIESLLEKNMLGEISGPIINTDNRQMLINYLVYLEGLAPLILRGVLKLEHVDDLFAYRYFLAINNPAVQEDQLFEFPEYYRGCFKLYDMWKRYRKEHQRKILMEEHSLDKWIEFEHYIDSPVHIRPMVEQDSEESVAQLIYDTDPYIYPAAFGTRRNAKRVISILLKEKVNMFSKDNIIVAAVGTEIVGVSVILNNGSISDIKRKSQYGFLPKSFSHTCEHYFNNLKTYLHDCDVYATCICVDKRRRGQHIGEMMVKYILYTNHGKTIKLHVLEDNKNAISLYEKYGFVRNAEKQNGYSYNAPFPLCYEMVFYNGTGK